MNTLNTHESIATWLTAWGPALMDHLWQSTLFALLLFLASMAVRRGPASFRHSLWLFALGKFLVPTALIVFLVQRAGIDPSSFFSPDSGSRINFLQGIAQPVTSLVYRVDVVVTTSIRHNEIYCALIAVSLIGTFAFLGVWAKQRRRFFRALNGGYRANHGREWQALERARDLLKWKTEVALVITPDKTEPAVCRVWKPVLLLPQSIADHLTDAELEAIMLHELVHIRRQDNLVGNLQMAVCALLWFHPLVWLISNRLFDERELACDEEVLKLRAAPEAYAAGILKVVRFSLGWRVAGVTGAGSGSNLRRRIENIMTTNNTKRSVAVWHRLFVGTLVGLAIVVALAAGFNTRARALNAVVETESVQAVDTSSLADFVDPVDQVDVAQDKSKAEQPAQPPQPEQPSQPAQSDQPSQPAPPTPPAQPSAEAASAIAPVPPVVPTAASPATPPTPPAKEKSKLKDKVKEKDEKRKVEKGGLIDAPQPLYPVEARERMIQGEVNVAIVVGEDGNVISAKPISGPAELQGAARDAAFKARFHPSRVDGQPVKVSGALSYNFTLEKR